MKKILILFILTILITGLLIALQKANYFLPIQIIVKDSIKIKADTLLKNSKPVFGYRYAIYGDFDGDHKTDTLYERYTDSTFKVEAPKYYDNPDTNFEYEHIIFLNEYLNKKSFLEWKQKNLKLDGGQLGFHYIENCGDLNLDGKDEILLVKQWSDFSNINTAYIYTLLKNEWKEIYSTPIWEWQFPQTPTASMVPGLFGDYNFATLQNDCTNKILERKLKEFKFIKYCPDHSIEFSGMNPISIWNYDNAQIEFDSLGQQEYLKKHYDKVYINDSIYIRDKENPSINYQVEEANISKTESVILFSVDDPAEMVTTRIYINQTQSPFRKNKKNTVQH